jgi:aryl-alcohol dehydrogenase-like predicted oxidoreductase
MAFVSRHAVDSAPVTVSRCDSLGGVRYRQLGSCGPTVSVVGLGCTNFGTRTDLERTRGVVHAALDAGVTFFDTADIHGGQGASEELVRQVPRAAGTRS